MEICDGLDNDCDGEIDEGFDLQNDVHNCGNCGNVCSFPHATAACVGGACTIAACDEGFANCTASVEDGCETRLGTVNNCGACADVCGAPHTTAVCDQGGGSGAGICTYTCDAGFANCNGSMANGCEVNTQTDPNHCGSCNHVCPSGMDCRQGLCKVVCSTTGSSCDCASSNGCSGNGCCTDTCGCVCDEGWSGAACNVDVRPTPACRDFTTCQECRSHALSLGCAYCATPLKGPADVCLTAIECQTPHETCP